MLRKVLVLPTVAAALMLAPTLKADSSLEKASMLLQRVEANAIDARHDAARLRTFTRSPGLHSWQLHAAELTQIKERVNEIGELMGEFKAIKDQASNRQNKAFNAAVSQAAELADATEDALKIVNQDKQKVEMAHPDRKRVNVTRGFGVSVMSSGSARIAALKSSQLLNSLADAACRIVPFCRCGE
jgi:hypothetical protein